MSLVYVIEDDALQREFMVGRLRAAGYEVHPMKDAWNAMEEIKRLKPDVVLTDIMHPGITGGDLYLKIREELGAELPVLISSASHLRIHQAQNDPLLAYSPKPVETTHLLGQLNALLNRSNRRPVGGTLEA